METYAAMVKRLISELRAAARDAQRDSHAPCQSQNTWHADDYNRWADTLESVRFGIALQAVEVDRNRLKAASAWQPIETAPRDGTVVLLGGFHRGKLLIDMDSYDEGDPVDEVPPHWPWRWHANAGCEQPQFWLPLPAPPEIGSTTEATNDHSVTTHRSEAP